MGGNQESLNQRVRAWWERGDKGGSAEVYSGELCAASCAQRGGLPLALKLEVRELGAWIMDGVPSKRAVAEREECEREEGGREDGRDGRGMRMEMGEVRCRLQLRVCLRTRRSDIADVSMQASKRPRGVCVVRLAPDFALLTTVTTT